VRSPDYQKLCHPTPEDHCHGLVSGERDVEDATLIIKAAFENDSVHMGMESQKVSRRLVGQDCRPGDGPPGRGALEISDHAVDQLHQLGEESAVMTEIGPQQLGDGEGEDAVRQTQQEVLRQELGEKQSALLGARWTQIEGFA
jgi:hypothetical protein